MRQIAPGSQLNVRTAQLRLEFLGEIEIKARLPGAGFYGPWGVSAGVPSWIGPADRRRGAPRRVLK